MLTNLIAYSGRLSSEHGISHARQLAEMLATRWTAGIGISEYYELELFDRDKYPTFANLVGRRRSARIDKLLNNDYWRATANDKFLNYALLSHPGMPIPKPVATFNAGYARIDNKHRLSDKQSLHSFFNETSHFPLF